MLLGRLCFEPLRIHFFGKLGMNRLNPPLTVHICVGMAVAFCSWGAAPWAHTFATAIK